MIGEIYLNDCVARPSSCKVTYSCAVHRVWMDARDQLRETLRQVNFAQLVKEESCVPIFPVDDPAPAESLESDNHNHTERLQ